MFFLDDANISFKFENLDIKILRINMGVSSPYFPMHSHGRNFYELHFVINGSGSATVDNTTYHLSPGTVYITGPLVPHEHKSDTDAPLTELCIQLEISKQKYASGTYMSDSLINTTFWMEKDLGNSDYFIELLKNECTNIRPGYTEAAKHLVGLILISLLRCFSGINVTPVTYQKSNLDYKRLNIIEDSFFKDFATLSLPELAQRLKLSPRQTQRFLKNNYSRTFIEMLSDTRVNKAREFIHSGMSIKDAAAAVGYDDIRSLKRKL